ncbi:hypothetical protein H1C71_038176, partial [Ictidomys tridecemlineatus]
CGPPAFCSALSYSCPLQLFMDVPHIGIVIVFTVATHSPLGSSCLEHCLEMRLPDRPCPSSSWSTQNHFRPPNWEAQASDVKRLNWPHVIISLPINGSIVVSPFYHSCSGQPKHMVSWLEG